MYRLLKAGIVKGSLNSCYGRKSSRRYTYGTAEATDIGIMLSGAYETQKWEIDSAQIALHIDGRDGSPDSEGN